MRAADLKPNEQNPRKISPKKLEMLRASLAEFGDLSGIVFNRRSKQLIGGHQRAQILPPDAEVVLTHQYKRPTSQGTVAEGHIVLAGERYAYREVDFDEQRERAANIAANRAAGDWDMSALKIWMRELDDGIFDLDLTMFDVDDRLKFAPDPVDGPKEKTTFVKTCMCPKCGHEFKTGKQAQVPAAPPPVQEKPHAQEKARSEIRRPKRQGVSKPKAVQKRPSRKPARRRGAHP